MLHSLALVISIRMEYSLVKFRLGKITFIIEPDLLANFNSQSLKNICNKHKVTHNECTLQLLKYNSGRRCTAFFSVIALIFEPNLKELREDC